MATASPSSTSASAPVVSTRSSAAMCPLHYSTRIWKLSSMTGICTTILWRSPQTKAPTLRRLHVAGPASYLLNTLTTTALLPVVHHGVAHRHVAPPAQLCPSESHPLPWCCPPCAPEAPPESHHPSRRFHPRCRSVRATDNMTRSVKKGGFRKDHILQSNMGGQRRRCSHSGVVH